MDEVRQRHARPFTIGPAPEQNASETVYALRSDASAFARYLRGLRRGGLIEIGSLESGETIAARWCAATVDVAGSIADYLRPILRSAVLDACNR